MTSSEAAHKPRINRSKTVIDVGSGMMDGEKSMSWRPEMTRRRTIQSIRLGEIPVKPSQK